MSQRPWDKTGETLEGRHRGGPRTETDPENRETDSRGQQRDHPGDRRGDRGTPETGRGARDPNREARERRREEDTLQSEGGKWDMEVPGDLIGQEDSGCRNVPGDGRTNHPRLRGQGGGSQGGGSRDRGLAALRPGKSSQNWAERATWRPAFPRHHRDQRAHRRRHPATDEAAVARERPARMSLEHTAGPGQGRSVEPPSQRAPERHRAVLWWSQDCPPTSLPQAQASTCVTCYELRLSLGQGEHDWAPLSLMGAPGLAAPQPDVARCSGPASARRRNGAPAGPRLGHPRAATCSVLSCGHRCRPLGTHVTQLCTPTAVPGS